MNLIKITDVTAQLGLSSRTLRYYEQAGLITSIRPQFEAYRYYDESAVVRLRQILVLRKMQISIKDIVRIYENPEMATIVDVFTGKIHSIDAEVIALSELRSIIDTFLQKMIEHGVKKISALPLLYEEMERQMELREEQVTYAELEAVNRKLAKPVDTSIIKLPRMRMLTSYLKEDSQKSDPEGLNRWLQEQPAASAGSGEAESTAWNGPVSWGEPGQHTQFEFHGGCAVRIPEEYVNETPFMDGFWESGLWAVLNVYVDEDLNERYQSLVHSYDENEFYQIDYLYTGELRQPVLLETLISPDERRELAAMMVPVKKRVVNPALYEPAREIENITIEEIEAQNPVLWQVDVPLESLTAMNDPYYQVMDNGEAAYSGTISTRVLGTNVAVRVPFRVDMEFRLAGEDERFAFGSNEGSMVIYHGNNLEYYAGGDLGLMGYGVNMGNEASETLDSPLHREQLNFRQPIYQDLYSFPHRGRIHQKEYNKVTWIIGANHLAAIINDEIRYCGTHFPYMALDLNHEPLREIVIGSNGQGMKYIRSIQVSQLMAPIRTHLQSDLSMSSHPSNNIIPNLHRLITDEYGENYWFNGCARYVMEGLGHPEYDYQFWAGLTGDTFVQCYPKDQYRGSGVSECMLVDGDWTYFEDLFCKCGYSCTCITYPEIQKNLPMYLRTLMSYIDRGVPVISWGAGEHPTSVYVGYEDHGRTLLYISGNSAEPYRMPIEDAFVSEMPQEICCWMFVGAKTENPELANIYREAIMALPELLTVNNERYAWGAEAFRIWAEDIESGRFEQVKPEEFDQWFMYTTYICQLATNGSCCHEFLKRAQDRNPDMQFIDEVSRLYDRFERMWHDDNGNDLEALGGGFNCTLEALQDPVRRTRIANKLREFANVTDRIVELISHAKVAHNH